MPRTGWLGLSLFSLASQPRTVSCVLSGGGSRASFQLGALRYLYAHDPSFTPTIFVGASAGSILASALAQHADREGQAAVTARLWDLWSGMRSSEEMFTPRPWLAKAQAEMPGWIGLMGSVGNLPAQAPPPSRPTSRFGFWRQTGSPASPDSPPDPLELALTPDEDIRPDWSLGVLATLAGNVGRLPRIGSDLAAIRLGMEHTRSMYRPGPVLARLLDPALFSEERVRAAGTTLRLAMVSLESGELRFMREDGTLVDRTDRLVDDTFHGLATGVLASCSIPAVFRPVPIGPETYIDGGARENLPAELAIGHLRAERTYVLSSQTVGVPARQSMAEADLFSIVMRSTEILIDEAGRDELAYARSADAIVVHPEIDVHDAMTVHPGLIQINADYGWMRAAEQVHGASTDDEDRTRRIVALRMRCVRLEERLFAGEDDARTGARLAAAKADLRQVVAEADPELLPPGAHQWWLGFEDHPTPPDVEPPWLEPSPGAEASGERPLE